MEFVETIRTILTQFTDEAIGILLAILAVLLTMLMVYWLYNRRRFRQFSHQIPASVVKNYLDSIIFNSNALKSSLFRGGGLKLGEGVPSVVPANHLSFGGTTVEGGEDSEGFAQKNAEIASLRLQIGEKNKTVEELERMLSSSGGGGKTFEEENTKLKNEIEELKSQLVKPSANNGDQLDSVTKERDKLKERLMEYEIIEEDLANLKRFQEENQKLKEVIDKLKAGGVEPVKEEAPLEGPVAEEAPEEEPIVEAIAEEAETETALEEPEPEAVEEEEIEADDSAMEAAQEEMPEIPANEGKQKSAEELLSEFEKMLG